MSTAHAASSSPRAVVVRRGHLARRLVAAAAVASMLCGAIVAATFLLTGGRYFIVRTPSMGTAAPVGTLVLARPTKLDDVEVGDVIAFHPPTVPDETYTHRVVAITPAGLRTRGDINGATDPWTVTGKDLVGRADVLLPGVGWLVRALPLLIIGGVLVWTLTAACVSRSRRGPARQVGFAVVFLIASVTLRPFVGVSQLASADTVDGASRITAVSTGLLPVRLTPHAGSGDAAPVDLATAGRTGVSILTGGEPGTSYHLDVSLHLNFWHWVAAIVISLSPLLWTLIVGFRGGPVVAGAHRAATS